MRVAQRKARCRRCGRRRPVAGGYCGRCYGWLVAAGYAWDEEAGELAEPVVLFGDRPGPASSGDQVGLFTRGEEAD